MQAIKNINPKTYTHKKENKMYSDVIKKHEVIIKKTDFMDNYANHVFLLT